MAVKHRTTVDRNDVLEAIRLHAEGKGAKKVSTELGISLALLKRALMRYDLESEWDEATDKAFPGMRESATKMTAQRTGGVKVDILPDPEPDPEPRDELIERGDEDMTRAKVTVAKTVPGPKTLKQAARATGPPAVKGVDKDVVNPGRPKRPSTETASTTTPITTPKAETPFDLGELLGSPTAKIILGGILLLGGLYLYKRWRDQAATEKGYETEYEPVQQPIRSETKGATRQQELEKELEGRWESAQ